MLSPIIVLNSLLFIATFQFLFSHILISDIEQFIYQTNPLSYSIKSIVLKEFLKNAIITTRNLFTPVISFDFKVYFYY